MGRRSAILHHSHRFSNLVNIENWNEYVNTGSSPSTSKRLRRLGVIRLFHWETKCRETNPVTRIPSVWSRQTTARSLPLHPHRHRRHLRTPSLLTAQTGRRWRLSMWVDGTIVETVDRNDHIHKHLSLSLSHTYTYMQTQSHAYVYTHTHKGKHVTHTHTCFYPHTTHTFTYTHNTQSLAYTYTHIPNRTETYTQHIQKHTSINTHTHTLAYATDIHAHTQANKHKDRNTRTNTRTHIHTNTGTIDPPAHSFPAITTKPHRTHRRKANTRTSPRTALVASGLESFLLPSSLSFFFSLF